MTASELTAVAARVGAHPLATSLASATFVYRRVGTVITGWNSWLLDCKEGMDRVSLSEKNDSRRRVLQERAAQSERIGCWR